MKVIYQVDKVNAQEIKFCIQDKYYTYPLSSFALKEHLEKNGIKVILIHPASMIFDKNVYEIANLPNETKKYIKTIVSEDDKRESYFRNPHGMFEIHPFKELYDDIFPIHSIGEFEGIKFEGDYDDIVLEIFIHLCGNYIESPFKELYIDISTGHNIYISALLEAARHFAVFSSLINWYDKGKIPAIFVSFSDPIIGSPLPEYKIYWYKLKFKSFFSSPIKYNVDFRKGEPLLAKRLAEKNKELKAKIQEYFENFAIIFSSIKNNIPLGIYHFGYHNHEDALSFLQEVLSLLRGKLYQNFRISPKLEKEGWLKLFLSLGFYLGIIEVLEHYGIKKYEIQEGISLDKIKNVFGASNKSIYKIFDLNLNIEWLGKELWNYMEGKEKLINKVHEKWCLLKNYLSGITDEFNKRNFLAHCGFERNITETRRNDGKIYMRWWTKEETKIKRYLLEEV
jgi:CRISPR-associated protein Csx1